MKRTTTHRFPDALGPARSSRRGLSLLEVLIACGILVLGLAGVAALLPAASMRFADAMVADRARFVAVVAHADVLNRGLATAAACTGSGQGVAFGQVATAAAGLSPALTSAATVTLEPRVFVSEDEVTYGGEPLNVFTQSGVGPRAYRDSLVWGATLVPTAPPGQAGGNAILSIVVFRRPGAAQLVTLTAASDGSWLCGDADRQRFLRPCSAALLVGVGNVPVRPQWLSVRASWSGGVILAADAVPASASIQVIGFENVLRVEHHTLTLQ